MNGLEDKTEAEALCLVMVPKDDIYGDYEDDGGLVDLDGDDELGVYDDDDYDDGDNYDSE